MYRRWSSGHFSLYDVYIYMCVCVCVCVVCVCTQSFQSHNEYTHFSFIHGILLYYNHNAVVVICIIIFSFIKYDQILPFVKLANFGFQPTFCNYVLRTKSLQPINLLIFGTKIILFAHNIRARIRPQNPQQIYPWDIYSFRVYMYSRSPEMLPKFTPRGLGSIFHRIVLKNYSCQPIVTQISITPTRTFLWLCGI